MRGPYDGVAAVLTEQRLALGLFGSPEPNSRTTGALLVVAVELSTVPLAEADQGPLPAEFTARTCTR